MNRVKELFNNTLLFTFGNIGTKFINFLMVPLYTYMLSQGEYGTIDLIFSITTLVAPIIMLNINEAIIRYCLDKNPDISKIINITATVTVIGIVLSIVCIPIIKQIDVVSEYAFYIYCLLVLTAIYPTVLAYLRGTEQIKLFSISNIINTVLMAGLNIVFLVTLKMGIEGYLLANIFSYSTTSVFILYRSGMYHYFKRVPWDSKLAKQMIKYSIALVPNSLLWWINNSSSRFILIYFLGTAANGLFAVAYKIPSLLTTLTQVFSQAWQISAIKENESEDREAFNNKMYRIYFKFIFIVGSGVILVLKPVMRIYVSLEFYEAWRYTPLLLYGFMILALATFLGTSYYVEKNTVGNMFSAVGGAVVSLLFNFILIPIIGVNGAALATCIGYITVFIYRAFDTQKYIRIKVVNKDCVFLNILFILQMALVYFSNWIAYVGNFIMFLGILFIGKELIEEFFSIIGMLLKRKKRK